MNWWNNNSGRAKLEMDKLNEEFAKSTPGPPCKDCRYWNPKIKSNNAGFDGVAYCTSKDMWNDFSCFQEKDTKK